MKSRGHAFTLIELLTVIAVLGILAAILIPVVGSVRKSANDASAISNLRQTAQAEFLYASDNKSCFTPIWAFDGDETWQSRLLGYLYPPAQSMNATDKRNYLLTLRADRRYVMGVPDADISDPYRKSIGFNTYIASPSNGPLRRTSSIERPAGVIMLAEMKEQNAEVVGASNVAYRRAGGKAGIAYCDGSVRLVAAATLANVDPTKNSPWRFR